jgi:Tol biopolymer transport system component
VIRRVILIGLATVAAGAALTGAASPEGPRLALIAREYGKEVITIGPRGEDPRQIVDPDHVGPGHGPSWSADGSRLAFIADVYPDDDPVLGVVDADGSNLRIYPRTPLELGDPIMAPDGGSVAFARAELKALPGRKKYSFKTSIWSFDLGNGAVRRLARWRAGYLIPSSYSPDGATIAASAIDSRGRRFRAVAIDLRSGRTSLLAREATAPIYSPDGASFAFLRLDEVDDEAGPPADELWIGRVGSVTGSRLLLRKRGALGLPSWDPSGQRLAFTHSLTAGPEGRSPKDGNRVMEINADGTCLRTIFSDPDLTLYGPVWQPGLGREAGPLAC